MRHTHCSTSDDMYMILWCVHHIPLADTTHTHKNLSTVLKHVVEMEKLMDCLDIPPSIRRRIEEHNKSEKQQRDECIRYWRNVSPYSMIGWSCLGSHLHYYGQEAALRAAHKYYIQRAPGSMAWRVHMYMCVLDWWLCVAACSCLQWHAIPYGR